MGFRAFMGRLVRGNRKLRRADATEAGAQSRRLHLSLEEAVSTVIGAASPASKALSVVYSQDQGDPL